MSEIISLNTASIVSDYYWWTGGNDQGRRAFLQDQTGVREGTVQINIKLLTETEWMASG